MTDETHDTTTGPTEHDGDLPTMTSGEWAARRETRRQDRKSEKWYRRFTSIPVQKRWLYGVPIALMALVLLVAVVEVVASAGRIHPGVQVGAVSVGGMSPESAKSHLDESLAPRMAEPVTLVFEETSWSVEPTQVVATFDATSAVAAAMEVGRSGGFWDDLGERLASWVRPTQIPPPVIGDPELVEQTLDLVADVVDQDPVDAAVVIEDLSARIEPSALGVAIRREELAKAMLTAFASEQREVEVGADFVPVSVTEEDAEQAASDAEAMMSGPVTVMHESESWDFTAEQISGWIDFRKVYPDGSAEATAVVEDLAAAPDELSSEESATPMPGMERMILQAFIAAEAASETVTPLLGTAGHPASDARFQVSNGAVTIVPSQDGVGPDIDALALEMTTVLTGDGERVVSLRTMRVAASITTEDAQAMGITERLSTYTTSYSAGNAPRVNNIHTLADAMDGTLLAPGETFSFNETIGPRTAAKGYQEAPAIVNGQLVPQLGGGICQVGTTIFNSVFESGLPVVERKNHSFYISHYPKGRDATVSWGGPDFKFSNDTEHYVLIATGYSSSSLTVSIYGTDPGYEVRSTTGSWYDVTPHRVREVEDPTLAEGVRVVEDSGVDGRKILVTRTVLLNGSVVREDKFTSVYKSKEEVVKVGTMPVAVPTTTTPLPSP